MTIKIILSVAALAISSTGAVQAATVGALSVESPQGDLGGSFALDNIINQSGLSANYVNGVTDFGSFVSSTTHSLALSSVTGFTGTSTSGPQQFTFDLGLTLSVSALALWGTSSVGAVTSFSLFADNDADFSNGTTGQLLGPSALSVGSATPDVYSFGAVNTQFIHVNGLTSLDAPDFYGLGEVIFDGVGISPVPVPASLPLMVTGFGGLVMLRRRKKKASIEN